MKKLLTVSLLFVLCLTARASAQVTTTTLILEDDAMTLGSLNQITIAAPPDQQLTSNYALCFPNQDNLGIGSFMYISGSGLNNQGQFSHHFDWLAAGGQGEVLMMVGGVPRWRPISPPTLPLSHNALWVGDATDHASELPAGTNGQVLRINGTTPTWETLNILPTGTTNNSTLVWNGTSWIENTNVMMNPTSGDITTTGDVNAVEVTTTGDANVGGSLTVVGPNVNLPAGSVDNSELANDDVNVTYGTGLSGDGSVVLGGTLNLQNTGVTSAVAGTGINLSGGTGTVTITNTGVTSLTGTANQVSVSAANGDVTVSLPQNIDNNATPTFDGVTLDNLSGASTATEIVVSNGGSLETRDLNSIVSSSTLSENSLWMGNALNNPSELAAGANGQVLRINGTTPTWETLNILPTGTTNNSTLVWNGTSWIENTNVTMNPTSGDITTSGDVNAVEVTTTGDANVGGNLTVVGPNVTLPAGSVDNSELANDDVNVTYGTGLSGDGSVVLGGTLNLQNTGVTSLTGTANQVSVSAANGDVTVSLPQNIDNNATPTFDGVTLDNLSGASTATEIVVSNGGSLETRDLNSIVSSSTLSENNLWMGNALNNPSELAPGTNGQVLQVNGGAPSWQTLNLLPTGTTNDATLVWDGTSWIENTNVTMNPTSGDITTNGDVNAVEVTTTGNANVGGNLTVAGPNVTLPAGSVDNSELANDDVNVTYGTGLSGDGSVVLGGTLNLQNTGVTSAVAGTGINLSGGTGAVTITNTGVTSLTGTANQVSVSAANGDVTVSLPQNIDNNATPTFDGVTLDNLSGASTATEIVVSNGGSLETRDLNSIVSSSTLSENNLWMGNALNNPSELAPGTNGQVLQVNGGAPSWQTLNLLPTGTTNDATLVWNGTSWIENTNVTMNPTSGDITTNGDVNAVEVTTTGDANVGGNLTVVGPNVTLPAGSVDNSELANDDVNVTYGTGLSGDASVVLGGTLNLQNTGVTSAVAGTGINLSGGTGAVTITNTGVTSLTGTANQVSVSAANGDVTVSLPQNIDNNARPTFDGVTLDNLSGASTATEIVVSNGGSLETRDLNSIVGSTTLSENSLWMGNALNNPSELAAGANGQVLRINGTTPTWETLNILPTGTTNNSTLVWNGTSWVENTNVTMNPTSGDITTTGDVNAVEVTTTGNANVGGNLTVAGPNVTLPAGSVDNSELANDDVNVTYGTGLSGDGSVVLGGTLNLQNTGVTSAVAGTGINLSGGTGAVTITNTGVTSLTGTANQVSVSAASGDVTVSLPQNIDNNATPTFDGVTLDNLSGASTATEIVVSNGGSLETRDLNSIVGSSTLSENSLWMGNALNNPSELAAGANGQVLRINGITPTWETLNILPTGTTNNSTLVWNGTSWVENTNVTMNPTSGDITTTGDVNAVEVTTTGNANVGGNLTVAGPNVTLPAGSVDNSELANDDVNVTYGTGLSGDGSVVLGGTLNLQNTGVTSAVAGTGINLSGGTGAVMITNTGVTSLTGTANQVSVSAANGDVTVSLPQSIATSSSPEFAGMTLNSLSNGSTATDVVVSNGGALETRSVNSIIGSSSLSQNSMWMGSASNTPVELAPGSAGQVLMMIGGTPTWQLLGLGNLTLPQNSMLVGNVLNVPTVLAPGTSGQALRTNASGAPEWQNVVEPAVGTTTNSTLRWNGTQWVENTNMTSDASGNTAVGGNLTVSGPNVTLPAGSVDNSELANDDVNVTYGTGLSGDGSVVLGGTLNLQNTGVTSAVAGTGINLSGGTGAVTITNTGVTSLTGTANQVSVSAANGDVTVSLPQNIDNNATPTFDGIVLDNLTGSSTATEVVVSNGGTLESRSVNSLIGGATLSQNSLWVGNASNNPSELVAGANGQILTVVGGVPTWQNQSSVIPNGTTNNSTLVWNGTNWVENTNVTLNPVTGDVNATGSIAVGGNSNVGGSSAVGGNQTVGGNSTVTGNLTVSGTSVTLPAGSVDNSELANDDVNVTYGTGLSGDGSVVLGGTLNLQNTGVTSAVAGTGISVSSGTGAVTIANTGVTSLAGTANQVNVSAATGGVTLSLPQSIHTGATPTFNRMTLTNLQGNSTAAQIVVSNNGVLETRSVSSLPSGSTSLNHNSMWVGNASNQATQLGSTGVSGAVLQLNNSGAPQWSNDLNVHNVTISSALTVNGNQVNNGDVRFNGNNFNVAGSTNTVFDGRVTVNGITTLGNTLLVNGATTLNSGLTVNGSPVNLPNNSIDNNELVNSSVNVSYGTGLSGGSTVALGGTLNLQNTGVTSAVAGQGISVSGNTGAVTITNTGVRSLTGTANQVNVSASTGGVTLSLPQNIHTGATPTFNRMTLTNLQGNSSAAQVVVSNNGVLETRNASTLGGGSGWSLTGNSGTTAGTNFLGTTDNVSLDIRVNNERVFRFVPNSASPMLIGGYSGNSISSTGTEGNAILSGGANNEQNVITEYADYSLIVGGAGNEIGRSADYAVLVGGYFNELDEETDYSFIGAGQGNIIYDRHSAIVSGFNNRVGSDNSNWADAAYSGVVSGYQNNVSGLKSFIGAGLQNAVAGDRSAVVSGHLNSASGDDAFVGGGRSNTVSGDYSAIAGGRGLTLSGTSSFGFLADNSGSNDMSVSEDDVAVIGNANLWLANNNNDASQLRFYEPESSSGSFPSSTKYSSFEARSQSSDIRYLLPETGGAVGEVLTVESVSGSEVALEWASAGSSSGGTGSVAFARKTADETVSGTTLQDDDHLSISLAANSSYEISGVFYAERADGNPDMDVAWSVPGGTGNGSSNSTMLISFVAAERQNSGNRDMGADTRSSSGTSPGDNAGEIDLGSSGRMVIVHFKGIVMTGSTSGNVTLKWAPTSGGGDEVRVLKNSYMTALKLQ